MLVVREDGEDSVVAEVEVEDAAEAVKFKFLFLKKINETNSKHSITFNRRRFLSRWE